MGFHIIYSMLNKAVINLNTLRKNARAVKSKLKKGVKLCAVVKADAYGHGAEVVSNSLYTLADSFAVATVEEGVSLRLAGIDKPILVLIPPQKKDVERSVHYRLTNTVVGIEQIKMLSAVAKRQGVIADVHIKYNTGMNRQGIDSLYSLKQTVMVAERFDNVNIGGLYTHFAFPENKKSLNSAVNKFLLANNFIKGYNNKVICHASASGGFLAGVQFDQVRIGLLLYGYKPYESDYITVNPIMKVYAPVVYDRFLTEGDCALYGDKSCDSDTHIYLIRYGYADGLFRKEVKGQYNCRCMDITAVTELKNTKYGAVVMDNADVIAKKYRTISYEILTKCSLRAEKIYLY